MTPSLSPEMRSRMVEAYLGHRLNHYELVDLVGIGQKGEAAALEDTFKRYSDRKTDRRAEVSSEQLDQVWDQLGLKEQFANLNEDKVWSAEDRAVYRRLSRPGYDPAIEAPADGPAALDKSLVSLAGDSFSDWDRDGNIRLDRNELDYLLSGGYYGEKLTESNNPEKAAVLATLLRFTDLLGSGAPSDGSGISLADLNAWAEKEELIDTGAMSGVNEVYREYRERAYLMANGKDLGSETISGSLIHQGVVGSCVLLSTGAGTQAQDLGKMLSDNGDGTHTVTFADGPSEQVVDPSLAARLHHSQGKDGERWPAILEIAAAQRLIGEGKRAPDGITGAIDGIEPQFAIPAFTGKQADQRSIDELTLAQTRDMMELAMAGGGPVICGSRPTANGDFINVEELHNGIANGHCYSIKSFDRMTDRVVLQNPWHKGEWKHGNDPDDDGVFEMPLKDFYSSFRWVTFAKQGEAPAAA